MRETADPAGEPGELPGDVPGELAGELAEATVRVARGIRRAATAHLAPLGVTFGQGRLLRLLADGPLRMAEIATRMDVVPRSATDMVDALQRAGLAGRTPDPGDRRSVLVELTGAGHDLRRRMAAGRRDAARSLFAALPPAEQRQLLELLRTVLRGQDQGEQDQGEHCGGRA
jgi:DNA-binding MarR family transcriptional regulator